MFSFGFSNFDYLFSLEYYDFTDTHKQLINKRVNKLQNTNKALSIFIVFVCSCIRQRLKNKVRKTLALCIYVYRYMFVLYITLTNPKVPPLLYACPPRLLPLAPSLWPSSLRARHPHPKMTTKKRKRRRMMTTTTTTTKKKCHLEKIPPFLISH